MISHLASDTQPMDLKRGDAVFWSRRSWSGEVYKVQSGTIAGEPFQVRRSTDSVVVWCVALATEGQLRTVRLDDLSQSEPDKPNEQTQTLRITTAGRVDHESRRARVHGSMVAMDETPPDPDRHRQNDLYGWNDRSRRKELRQNDRASSEVNSSATAFCCNVLAIDFLNLLVRAFHAGKPTDIHAVKSLFLTVAGAIRKLRPAHVVFAMDGGHVKRSQLLAAYKATRPEPEPLLQRQKALAEQAIRIAGFHAIRVEGWEADDVLATIAMSFPDTVICSSDKDLLALPARAMRCRVYHPWGEGAFVTAEDKLGLPADHVTDFLALCGDSSDNVPGVKGIGPKTAAALLKEHGNLEAILTAATFQRIPGAVGKALKEQRATAMRCREVVELNHQLPLQHFEQFRPLPGWQTQLQELRLGAVAGIMEGLQGQRFMSADCRSLLCEGDEVKKLPVSGTALSAATEKAEQCDRIRTTPGLSRTPETVYGVVENSASSPPVVGSRSSGVTSTLPDSTGSDLPERTPATAGSAEGSGPVGRGFVAEQMTVRLTVTELRQIRQPPGFGDERCAVISSWLAGFRASQYPETANPWRKDSHQYTAFEQGRQGVDLHVTVGTPSPAASVTLKPKPRSLFDD